MTSMQKRNALHLIAASAISVCATGLLGACSEKKAEFRGVDVTGAEYARDIPLTDHNGQPRHIKDFAGKVVVVFFGYTQCPDVCPTTMQQLVETKQLMGADGAKVQGVFVTIDPARDTAELLKAYAAAFDPTFVGLRGNDEQTAAAAKEFKIFYRKVPGSTPQTYTMDHTAASYVIDTTGKPRLYVRHAMPPAELAADLKLLLAS